MSTNRTMQGGEADLRLMKRGPGGRFLCRWCGVVECTGRRSTFCSDECVDQWKMRTSPAYLRRKVFLRDKGVCAKCRLDTLLWALKLRRMDPVERAGILEILGIPERRTRSPWDADHIVPVAEGGGECDLRNLRTLCLPCHKEETALLRKRLAEAKRGVGIDGSEKPERQQY